MLYRSVDILTNSTEIYAAFVVGNTDDSQNISLQKSGAFCVLLQFIRFIVLRTIQLDDDFCFCAVKVGNISSQ